MSLDGFVTGPNVSVGNGMGDNGDRRRYDLHLRDEGIETALGLAPVGHDENGYHERWDEPMKQLDHRALVDFTRRWFALWTEADPQMRSRQVADLWAPSGAQVLVDPPQEVRDAATALAFPVPRLEVRGHDELHRRVTQAYTLFVEPGEYTFKAAGDDAVLLAPGLVGLGWDMVAVADGTVAGSGYDVMVLDDDGRILLDHQHILS